MFRLTLTIHPDEEDDLVTRLHDTPLLGLGQTNRDDGRVDFEAWYVSRADAERAAGGSHRIDEVAEENWNAPYQATWQAIEVGERWYLVPPGDDRPAPPGRFRLELKPGLAFGNGDHPTTHLCLIAIEELLRRGDRFLDVGCGSGLLGEAAHLLGAQAFGCDLDATDLPAESFLGSVDAVKPGSIDLAVMNIQAGVLTALWPQLARVTKRDVILSGFLEEQTVGIAALIEPPWRIVKVLEQEAWRALVATRFQDQVHPASP